VRRGQPDGAIVIGPDVIPVSVLTGFLGSGKTTMLGHLLRQPEFSRTAVVINEFGEIGSIMSSSKRAKTASSSWRPAACAARSAPTWHKPYMTFCGGATRAHVRRSIAS
jgi:hypothetical protein